MKRRLEIARGLLHYPKVLFLDEPTIGLDPQTRNYIWEYIEDLKKREGITIFLTTHYMEEAEHCDRIAIIDLGKIIALDTPEELKTMVGGDIIKLTTVDDEKAEKELKRRYPEIEMIAGPGVLLLRGGEGRGVHPRLHTGFRRGDPCDQRAPTDARRRLPENDRQGDTGGGSRLLSGLRTLHEDGRDRRPRGRR